MAASQATATAWPLVGREEELGLIDRCRSAGGRAVVVAGKVGVGKSRLAREALGRFEQQGSPTCWVQATASAATVPLGAFAGVLPDWARAEDPLELLRLAAQALRELASPGPVVVGVDDAHLLDPSSAALVLDLTSGGDAFVVMTIRSGAPAPDAVVSVWKDRAATRIELGALGRPETESLAEEVVGGPIEQSVRHWIYETSLGNALYACELTKGALAGGALRKVHGLWRMASRPSVAASLSELIAARMTGLSPTSTHALELLALGEPLPVAELLDVVGAETLTDVEARGLVVVSGGADPDGADPDGADPDGADPDAALAHPLFGEVIRAGLPAFRRRQLQLELATSIRKRPEPPARDLLRMARWLVEAGEELSNELLLDAAETANLAGEADLAADLARRAVTSGGGRRGVLLLARALVLRGHDADAAELLAGAEAQFETATDDHGEAVEYLELATIVLYWGLRRTGELRELLARARTWSEDPGWRQHLDRLGLIGHDDTPSVAATRTSAGIYADRDADPEVRRRAAPVLAANLFYGGRVREAYDLIQGIRPTVPLRDLTDEIALALFVAIALESGQGWAELETWASGALGEGIRLADHAASGRAALALGGLRFSQGRYVESSRWFAEAELQLERRDAGGLLAIVNSMQVGVACFTGDLEAIAPALERCLAACGGGEPLPSQLPYVARAQAWALLGRGDRPRAQGRLLDAAGQLAEMPVYAARLTYEALRAGAPARKLAPRLQHLARRCDGRLTGAYAAHATALAASDPDGLLALAEEMRAIGALRYATEAAAHAASAYAACGRHDSARRAATLCRALHDEGGGGTLPAIDGLEPGATVLTARERQLVELATRGLSNAEIADHLVLSIRTVESHLYRAMTKLGVANRRQLRADASRLGTGRR